MAFDFAPAPAPVPLPLLVFDGIAPELAPAPLSPSVEADDQAAQVVTGVNLMPMEEFLLHLEQSNLTALAKSKFLTFSESQAVERIRAAAPVLLNNSEIRMETVTLSLVA